MILSMERVKLTPFPRLGKAGVMLTLTTFLRADDGVTAIEYGLIAALIAVVIITAVALIGTNLTTTFGKVSNQLG